MIQLLALDIDGTIRNSQSEITDRTKDILNKAQAAGVIIAIASGRFEYGILDSARALNLDRWGGYIMAFNGGRIVNCSTGEVLIDRKMPAGLIEDFDAFIADYHCNLLTYDQDFLVTKNPENTYIQHEANINRVPLRALPSYATYMDRPLNKCMVAGDPEDIARLEKAAQLHYKGIIDVYRSEPFFIEMMPLGVNKGDALLELAAKLGIAREETMACGDGYNDVTMLQKAGLGVAMANAKPDVQACADVVTLSNDEDGVAAAVEKYIIGA